MAFTDLPADWPTRPLTEPRLVADVLDLLLSDADRLAGGLLIALCDDEARLLQPIVIGDLPARAAAGEGAECWRRSSAGWPMTGCRVRCSSRSAAPTDSASLLATRPGVTQPSAPVPAHSG